MFQPYFTTVEADGSRYHTLKDKDLTIRVDEETAELIRLCNPRRAIREVVSLFATYHEKVSVKQHVQARFIKQLPHLMELGFVHSLDGVVLASSGTVLSHGLPSYTQPWQHRLLFQGTTVAGLAMLLTSIVLMAIEPQLVPMASDKFWHPSLSLSMFTGFCISWIITYAHEFNHYIVARLAGLPASIHLSHRLHNVVAETRVQHIYTIPKAQRIWIYLSGIAATGAFVGVSTAILFWVSGSRVLVNEGILSLLRQVALIGWVGIIWEFQVFMKTDIYALLEDMWGINNLITTSKQLISAPFARIINTWFRMPVTAVQSVSHTLRDIPLSKLSLVKRYSVFYVLGLLVASINVGIYQLPTLYLTLQLGVGEISSGLARADYITMLDGIIPLMLLAIHYVLLAKVIFEKMSA